MHVPLTRAHLSVISAVTEDLRLLSRTWNDAINGKRVVAFLQHILRQVPGQVLVVWDGAAIHRCNEVKQFLTAGSAARLKRLALPGYAPDLNPDEGVWRWLKRVALGTVCCTTLKELRYELRLALARLRHRKDVLQACISRPGYIHEVMSVSIAEKWAAEREVLTVSGVRAVVNTIHVHLPGIEERTDREIVEAVLDALARFDGATALHVTPIVSDGWVTLDGDVQTPVQKAAVRRIVATILGVKGVTDRLTINAEASPVRIIAQIKEALQRACPEDGQAIDVELRDHTVILRGHVRSEAEIDEAEWVAWAPRGVEHVENRLELDATPPA